VKRSDRRRCSWGAIFLLFQFGCILLAQAQTGTIEEHWVATWATAQQMAPTAPPGGGRGPQPPPAQASSAQASTAQPAAANAPRPPQALRTVDNQTVRMIVRSSIGGRRVRIQLSNAFGNAPVVVGAAHIAIRSKDSAIVPLSDRTLSFSGKQTCTMGPGVLVISDPVDLDVPQLGDLAISLYLPGDTGPPTTHGIGLHTTYISGQGDFTGQPAIEEATTTQSYYWLSSVDVLAPADASVIVALGDSITDGAHSTPETNHMWPAVLAARLLSNTGTSRVAVVNEGIAGNRLLRDGAGVSALARLDRDALQQPGIKWLMILEGINDIGNSARQDTSASPLTADDVIGGLRQVIERAHVHGIRVAGGTLTPYEGAAYYSESGEAIRQAVNAWIRTSGAFDAFVDFDAAVRDPNDPRRLRADLEAGDHLHPSDVGYRVMANAVDLSVFSGQAAASGVKKR
jgi:lysophospholipase L1-like esterase